MDEGYIRVVAEEGSEDFMEFPIEEDDTLLLSTLQAQFPHAIGLKYRGSSGAWRALSANENVFAAPKGGWAAADVVYCVTLSEEKKRKSESDLNSSAIKKFRGNLLHQDLAVMNLPFSTTNEELKDYFEKNFGELIYCDVKKFRETGKSRGFGFIRFKDEDAAKNAIATEHFISGRRVEVKGKEDKPMKLFIGRVPDGTTADDLRQHFSQFGEVTDSYVPTPFKNYAFLQFTSGEVAKGVIADTHFFKGSKLNVVERNPEKKEGDKDKKKVLNDGNYSGYSTYTQPYTPYTPKREVARQGGGGGGGGGGGMNADLKNLLLQVIQNS